MKNGTGEYFRGRYLFETAKENKLIAASATFGDGRMDVDGSPIREWDVKVTFTDGAALRRFLFSANQDILNSIAENEVQVDGNLNYLYRFGFMAKDLLRRLERIFSDDDPDLPLIVDIKRGSLHDGPGIRSVVFFKGCPLRCSFCHNPETQSPEVEISFSAGKCLRCGTCVDSCPEQAISLRNPGRIDRDKCTGCGRCATVCPGRALRCIGQRYGIDTLVELLLRDLPFYRHSQGGVTLSGGECTLYPDYLESLLQRLKAHGIHLGLETCGYFRFEVFARQILPYIDLIYYDVKLADPDAHERDTGRTNRKILDNLRRLLAEKVAAVSSVRTTGSGHHGDAGESLGPWISIVACADNVSLLAYNPLGADGAVSLEESRLPVGADTCRPTRKKRSVPCSKPLLKRGEPNMSPEVVVIESDQRAQQIRITRRHLGEDRL